MMPRKYDEDSSDENDMEEEFEDYSEAYEEENGEGFELKRPTDSIKQNLMRNANSRGFERKKVDFSKRSGGGFSRSKGLTSGRENPFGNKSRGLPKRERAGPMNRTRGKSPFTYSAGLCLSRFSDMKQCSQDMDFPEDDDDRSRMGKKRMSWGVPWKKY